MERQGHEGLLFKILIVSLSVCTVIAQSNYCNVNGNIHQIGESWTTATGNNILKKCTCARKGQWNCAYVKEDALMVVADVSGIKKVKLSDGAGFNMPFIENLSGRTVAVDVDIESDTIYWTDVSYNGRGLYKATFSNGHNVRRFIHEDVFEPNGLAFDWLAKNIYWTDAQLGAIYAARENGQHRTMVVGGLAEPRAIVILPLHGLMFWSDQTDGTIESAAMDGSGRRIVIQGLGWPNEIAVDTTRSKVYWIDGKKRTIESCNFDGTSWSKVLDFSIAFDSPGFGLSLFGGRLYFSVWNEKSVYSVTALGQDLRAVVSDMDEFVGGVAIVNKKQQQAPISNNVGLCRKHMMPCSHICLPQNRGSYTCACPEKSGLALSYDMHTCREPNEFILYTSVYDGAIMMVSKDLGSQPRPVMLAQGDQPSAIDYDPIEKMVYWSDVATNAIYRMHLNGSAYDVFLQDGVGIVDGLSVDWVNRHLYFTNYGWEEEQKPYGRIEIIGLDRTQRKVLIHEDLDKPRDIVIDQEKGFLYYSDWGIDAKVVRADLDGRNPHIIPIDVENPNGLSLDDGVLFVTDSHRKSALIQVNGTIVYGRPPSLIKYDTVLEKYEENMDLGLEVPFGLTMDGKSLYITDWGTGSISEIDINTGITKAFLEGVMKPTGITRSSKKPKKTYVNECTKSKKCSHVCVPVDQTFSSCLCPDHIGKALSENEWNCVAPDRFTLIADVNKIIMLSDSPVDLSTYMVVRTFDDYSNIVALAYDPLTYYVYWADNGRQRICRKMLGSPLGGDGGSSDDIEVIYTDIEMVEGMALDAENRLLYWTDGALGTIEVIDLNGMTHATVLEHLIQPRAIALDANMGMMYWTEWGRAAMLMTSKMNGYDLRPLMTANLEWPNALFYDNEEDKVYVADGAKLKIQSVSSIEGDILDYIDLNGTVDHLFGVGKMGSYIMFTDWVSGSLYKRGLLESAVLIKNLTRPTQIHTHSGFIPRRISQCSTAIHQCSHICVPSPGSYTCLCPDHLVLAANLRNCVRPENLHLHTTTLEPPVFEELTTMAWADDFTEEPPEIEEYTLKIERLPDSTTQPNLTTVVITTPTEPATTVTTTEMTTVEQTTVTTIPPPPRFPLCHDLDVNETANFTVPLHSDLSYLDLNASVIGLRALDVIDKDLNVTLVAPHFARVYPGVHEIQFTATDDYNRTIYCNATITVKDTTPPRVLYCPGDLDVEAYDDEKTTFVTWMDPQFVDNSGTPPTIFNTHQQGHFLDGLHNITYTAYDDAGNAATCSFLLAVIHRRARCGSPWSPPNSRFTCHTDPVTGDQVCQISCEKDYRLSLKTPFIRCRDDLDKFSYDWLPFLDDNVCKKPEIGNPQQVVTLEYMCPCRPSSTFYDYAYQIMTTRLREAVDCVGRTYSLGLCVNAEKKLSLECVDNKQVDFKIKVDLAQVSDVPSMSEARRIVKRSVTDILDKAVAGKIKARGYDMRDYPASEEAKLSDVKILCKNGYKGVEDGCIACPRGTYWHNLDCEFCPLHTFQERAAMSTCMNCSTETGTRNVGSTHRSHCVVMTRAEEGGQVSVIVIVASAIGSIILVGILMSVFVTCWYKKKRKKQEEWMALKKKQRYRRRKNSAGNAPGMNMEMFPVATPQTGSTHELPAVSRPRTVSFEDDFDNGDVSDGRASKRSSSSGKRVTIKEETIEHSIPNRKDAAKRKGIAPRIPQPNWRMALVLRNTAGGNKKPPKAHKAPSSVASESARSEDESQAEQMSEVDDNKSTTSAMQSETETEKTMTDGQTTDNETGRSDTEGTMTRTESEASTLRTNNRLMSSTSDLGDETMSMTSAASSRATTPIKGVLKKPKRITSMDDSLVSDSTITNTIENSRISGDSRGRDRLRRSQRNGRSVSPNAETRQKQPLGVRRSVSFDRGPSAIGPGPHKLFDRDPRYLTVGGRPRPGMPPLRPGMPPNNDMRMQAPRFPPGARPPFMGPPRMIARPPPGAVIYRHPNHPNMRMAFVPMNQGGRPMMPGRMPMPPPYSNTWQGPYDSSGEWDNASQSGSEMDLRNPPRHMVPPQARMGFPPRAMYPRVRMPNGGMMPPPRYQGRFQGPGQRFPPQPGYFSDGSMMSG